MKVHLADFIPPGTLRLKIIYLIQQSLSLWLHGISFKQKIILTNNKMEMHNFHYRLVKAVIWVSQTFIIGLSARFTAFEDLTVTSPVITAASSYKHPICIGHCS
jgi:hypothetical protein